MLDISLEIYKALRTVFSTVLVPGEEGSPTEIIMAYQNATCPKLPYLCITRPNFNQAGLTPSIGAVVEHITEGEGEEPDTHTYTKDRVTLYQGSATITEIGGTGNMTAYVMSRLCDQDVLDLCANLKISILTITNAVMMPKIHGNGFEDEFVSNIEFLFAVSHTIDTAVIEDVGFVEDIVLVPSL